MKLIDFHKEWMKEGHMSDNGLCHSLPAGYKEEFSHLFANNRPENYWGYNGEYYCYYDYYYNNKLCDIRHKYTPLRQTMVLLLCAIHNEL